MESTNSNSKKKLVFLENALWSTIVFTEDTVLHTKYKLDIGGINVELPTIQYD